MTCVGLRHLSRATRSPGEGTQRDGTDDPASPVDDDLTEALVRTRRFFTRAEVSGDLRTLHQIGGRRRDASTGTAGRHDKVVRSTHGVNCTGSCSWKVYVKDGIITWEAAADRLPVGRARTSPEYEPRGCPRGAAFSWYTYSPTRVRYPYVRGVLLEMYREAKARLGDPVAGLGRHRRRPGAVAPLQGRPRQGRAGPRRRGTRPTEIVAAAHVHTIKKYGPGPGRRLLADPGDVDGLPRRRGPVLLADRRGDAVVLRLVRRPAGGLAAGVRRPDRRAGVRRLVGRRLPDHVGLQRAGHPDPGRALDDRGPLPGPEGRSRSPRTTPTTSSSPTSGCRRSPAPTARWRWRWATSSSRSSSSTGRSPYFTDYVKRYTDLPFLVTLDERGDGATCPASSSPPPTSGDAGTTENAAFKTVLLDAATGEPVVPERLAGLPLRRRRERAGGTSTSVTSTRCCPLAGDGERGRRWTLPRFDDPDGAPARAAPRRAGPDASPGSWSPRCSTCCSPSTAWAATACRATWPTGYDDAAEPYTPAWQEPITGVPAATAARIAPRVRRQRRGVPRPLDDHHGGGHQPLVPLRHDLPRVPHADDAHRLPGRQRRRLGALRRPGEGAARSPATRRWPSALDWPRPAAADDPDRVLVPAHRPVALRPVQRGRARRRRWRAARSRAGPRPTSSRSPPGWAGCRRTRRSTATRSTWPTRRRRPGRTPPSTSSTELQGRAGCGSPARTRTRRRTSPGC